MFGVSLLLTIFFLVMAQWVPAGITGVLAAGTGLFALFRTLMGATSGETVAQGKAFGRAPYTRTVCGSGAEVAKQLASILKQLQMGAVEQDWKVDWKQLKAMVADAELALKQGNPSRAVRVYGGSISFLMDQLRNQHGESASSSVDL
jgi:protein phosphatase